MQSIIYATAGFLAKAIQKGEVTSEEVVRAHLAQTKKHNDKLNAIVILFEEDALIKAKEADEAMSRGEIWGPLHGVPVTVKEAFDIKGVSTTVNFEPLKNNIASENSWVVSRIKKAGGIILGKTNVPITLSDYQTNGPIYGRTNNPFNHDYTPGGSTGGGAAAVAAGFSPIEIGSDIGGSIRVPAHFCGLYGLKPTENTVPDRGHVPPIPGSMGGVSHMGCFGPLSRSVSDLKLAFDIIKGPDSRDVRIAPILWQKPSNKTLSEYSIAWSDTFAQNAANNETCSLLKGLVKKISDSGGSISDANPSGFDFWKVWETWGYLIGHMQGQDIPPDIRTQVKDELKSRFKGPAAEAMIRGIGIDFSIYTRALKMRHRFIQQLQEFFEQYNFWLCPVAMTPAFKHKKSEDYLNIDDEEVDYHSACGAFTTVFNVTGHPVLVVPLGQNSEGMPIGLQIVGPYWSEPELFHFAEQLSKLTRGFKAPKSYI